MNDKFFIKGFLFVFLSCYALLPRLSPSNSTNYGHRLTIKKLPALSSKIKIDSIKTSIYYCLNTAHPIQIDADLSEWLNIPALILNAPQQAYNYVKWRGPSDLSAKTFALWDQYYFYFASEVADDTFDPGENHVYDCSGDWLKLSFNPDTTQGFHRYQTCPTEFGFMLTEDGPKAWIVHPGDSKQVNQIDLKISIKRQHHKKNDIIIYECAIPWETFAPLLPLLQNQCQFDLSIMDDDGDGDEGMMTWTPVRSLGIFVLDSKHLAPNGLIHFFRIDRHALDDFAEARVQFGILQSNSNLPLTIFSQLSYGKRHILIEDTDIETQLTQDPSRFEINWYSELMQPGQYYLAVGAEDSNGRILALKEYALFKYASRDIHEMLNRLDKLIQQYQSITTDWRTESNLPTLIYTLQKIRFNLDHIHDENDLLAIQSEIRKVSDALEAIWGGHDLVRQTRGEFVRAYWSDIDESAQPYILYIPDNYNPINRYPLAVQLEDFNEKTRYFSMETFHFSEHANQQNWLLVKPRRRGNPGNFNLMLNDVFGVISELQRHYSIDENQIYLTGKGIGATAAWYLALNFPHLFAAVAPIGGDPFVDPGEKWEQIIFHYKKKPRLFRENFKQLRYLPVSVYQSEHAPLASIEQTEKAIDLLDKYDIEYDYQKYERLNQARIPDDMESNLYDWLARYHINRCPQKIFLQCRRLKHSRKYWAQIDAFEKFYRYANMEVELRSKNRIKVEIENVRQYTLFLDSNSVSFDQNLRIYTEGDLSYDGRVPATHRISICFKRDSVEKKYHWLPGKLKHFNELHKSPEMEGPISEAYCSKFIILYDDIHPIQAGRNWESLARKLAQCWQQTQFARPQMMKLSEFSPNENRMANLIFLGLPDALPFLKKYPGFIPIECDSHSVKIAGDRIIHKHLAAEFIYPNPVNRDRYLLINTGISQRNSGDDTLDFIVVDRSKPLDDPRRVLAAGYFDQIWGIDNDLVWIYKKEER